MLCCSNGLRICVNKHTFRQHIMLIDVSLRQPGRDGKSVAIDFSIVTPAAESYCKEAAKTPLHAAGAREVMKVNKYSQSYKDMGDVHFDPFVVLESGGIFGSEHHKKCFGESATT